LGWLRTAGWLGVARDGGRQRAERAVARDGGTAESREQRVARDGGTAESEVENSRAESRDREQRAESRDREQRAEREVESREQRSRAESRDGGREQRAEREVESSSSSRVLFWKMVYGNFFRKPFSFFSFAFLRSNTNVLQLTSILRHNKRMQILKTFYGKRFQLKQTEP
jgi:hypothetical protein